MSGLYIAEKTLREIRKAKEGVENVLLSGGIKNMEQYQFLMGELSGLTSIEQLLQDLLKGDDNDRGEEG